MLHRRIVTPQDRALQRLKTFDLLDGGDEDFEIAFSILSGRARDVAKAYTRHYIKVVNTFPDAGQRDAFIERVTAGFKGRYDVPVGVDWILKGEAIAYELHRRGANITDHLGALSVAQAQEVIVVYEGIEDPAQAIRIAAKISRLQALDAEILLTTVKHLQTTKHFEWVQNEVKEFDQFLIGMDKITALKSDASQKEAEEARRRTQELAELSQDVSNASEAMANAMIDATRAASELRTMLDQVVQELLQASRAMKDAISVGEDAFAAVDELSDKSAAIQSIAALIEDVTDRSDVLALNASIEAARAGATGAGFGVVATEMKALSRQTACATGEIFAHVDAIKNAREKALTANRSMLHTFGSVNELMQMVGEDVTAKSEVITRISDQVDETALKAAQTRQSMSAINTLASSLSDQVTKAGSSLDDLSDQVREMRKGAHGFLADLAVRANSQGK